MDKSLSHYAEQFLANSIYRHLYCAEDTVFVRAITVALVICWRIIESVFHAEKQKEGQFELICDIIRAFSAEVEYSQKNLNKLFDFCYKFIKI